jgi:putative Mg2+ transporter-C (MgtC) family protein
MLTYQEIFLRLFISAILGSVVGLERERLDWVAGLRTHMLVCVGATLFMIVSAFGFADVLGHANVTLDPSRIAAQVVSGIGFLGAGTIIFRREVIHGLTTAASLWAVAAVGLSVGGGLYKAAVSATALVLLILIGLKPIETRLFARRRLARITLIVNRHEASLLAIESEIERAGLRLWQIRIQPGDSPEQEKFLLTFDRAQRGALLSLLDRLRVISGVLEISHERT